MVLNEAWAEAVPARPSTTADVQRIERMLRLLGRTIAAERETSGSGNGLRSVFASVLDPRSQGGQVVIRERLLPQLRVQRVRTLEDRPRLVGCGVRLEDDREVVVALRKPA
jgi:hypothetical protein